MFHIFYVYVFIYIYICKYASVYLYIYIYICKYASVYFLFFYECISSMCVCVCVCIYIYISYVLLRYIVSYFGCMYFKFYECFIYIYIYIYGIFPNLKYIYFCEFYISMRVSDTHTHTCMHVSYFCEGITYMHMLCIIINNFIIKQD